MLVSVLLTAILGGITYGMLEATNWFQNTPWVWMSLGFFFILTNLVYFLVNNAVTRRNQTFIYAMGGSTALRFILSIGFILAYLQFGGERELGIIVYFMCMYLLYTMFEIYFLITKLRAAKTATESDTKS